MLAMLVFITAGFALKKCDVIPVGSYKVLSRLELYIFLPAMNFYNMLTRCTVNTLKDNIKFTLCGLCIVVCAMLLSYPLSRLFIKNDKDNHVLSYQRNIYKYALAFGNFGFMGNYIVIGIWGQDGLFKYVMFTFFLSVLCNSWGLMILTPRQSHQRSVGSLLKRVFSPAVIALMAGAACGLLNLKDCLPTFATTALSNASSCMGPVAMVLAGIVIGEYKIGELLRIKKVYIISAMRLALIPAVMLCILKVIGMDNEIIQFALIAFAAPLGLNTVVFPAAYGGDVKTGASMTLVSHALSVITIPVMYYIFMILL